MPGSTARLPAAVVRNHALAPGALGIASAAGGVLMHVRFDVGGDFVLGEPLLILLALAIFIARGLGGGVGSGFLIRYLMLGLLMLVGYVLADVVAASTPDQFTRGWARVATLVGLVAAMGVLSSHGGRNLWWFGFGYAAGALASLILAGTPVTPEHWKLGYGPAIGLLTVLLAGFMPALAAALAIGAFGVVCVMLDSRSLGGFSLLTAAVMLMHQMNQQGMSRGRIKQLVGLLVGLACAAALLRLALEFSDEEFAARRDESNAGRYVLVAVGLQAVADSPLVGYGSWAADPRYVELLRREAARASVGRKKNLVVSSSMMPHAQWLQAWIEGGLFGAVYFLSYGIGLLTSLVRLGLRHAAVPTTPLFAFLMLGGLWNLVASPFLGSHRISIAMALAAIGLLARPRIAKPVKPWARVGSA